MIRFLLRKLTHGHIWRRIFLERLAEPIHLNLASLPVALFGSDRAKIAFDLVVRQQHAFGLLKAAEVARGMGVSRVSALEFGVANGAGLLNLCEVGARITRMTGVEFEVVGFDTGRGMPTPRDYRDHPEFYRHLDYPMQNQEALEQRLPANARLIIGDVAETVPQFLAGSGAPVGFVSVDVDYYWSSVEALRVLDGAPARYLPTVILYLDDIGYDEHNVFAGELLALEEFNQAHALRKITRFNMLRQKRLFQRAKWIEHMYTAHIFDHPVRAEALQQRGGIVLQNYYL